MGGVQRGKDPVYEFLHLYLRIPKSPRDFKGPVPCILKNPEIKSSRSRTSLKIVHFLFNCPVHMTDVFPNPSILSIMVIYFKNGQHELAMGDIEHKGGNKSPSHAK